MKRKPISIGVAGLGRVGWRFHCAQIARAPAFRLSGVADTDPARRREAEETYGCRAFDSVDALLDEGGLDALVIATPTHLHKPQALAALRRGLHVFLEKPMALDLREAQAIARAARRANRVLTVYQPRRATAWFQQAARLLRQGAIGDVYQVRFAMFRFARRDDWQSLRRFGGGMLANYGAHGLDLALSLTGSDVRTCFGSLRQVASLGDTEDVVKVIYETRAGLLGEVEINQASLAAPREFEAFGTRGVLWKDGANLCLRTLAGRLKAKRLDRTLASAGRAYPQDDVRTREQVIPVDARYGVDVYRDLARAIRTGAEPFVRPAETLAVMRLIEQARAAAGALRHTPIR